MADTIRVTVWGENVYEHKNDTVKQLYPEGMHTTIANALNADPAIEARTVTLQEPEHGLTEESRPIPTYLPGGGTVRTARSTMRLLIACSITCSKAWGAARAA